jgi:Heterokaryon incompatibility protein (HET)
LELDYEYIWIDALCIDQNDWTNWEEQSMRVPDIYGNAHIVIVAGRSEDSRHGFLTPTCSPEVPAVQFPYKGSYCPRSSYCWINLPRNEEIGPVDKRAWRFQENLLSRRMLIYDAQQLSFRGRKHHIFEDGSWTDLEENDDWYTLSFLALYQPPIRENSGGQSTEPRSNIYKVPIRSVWYDLTQLFSSQL